MHLELWQYAVALLGVGAIWFFIEMVAHVMGEPDAAPSRSKRFRRFGASIAIFVLLFVVATWAHRLVFL